MSVVGGRNAEDQAFQLRNGVELCLALSLNAAIASAATCRQGTKQKAIASIVTAVATVALALRNVKGVTAVTTAIAMVTMAVVVLELAVVMVTAAFATVAIAAATGTR